MNYKYITTPFVYFGGLPALFTGLLFAVAGGIYAYHLEVHFNGLLNIKFIKSPSFAYAQIVESLFVVGVLTVITLIISLLVKRKAPRLIDLAGTFLTARIPLLITLVFFTVYNVDRETTMQVLKQVTFEESDVTQSLHLLVYFALSALPLLIYSVYLHYRAFAICTNMKGSQSVLWFTAVFVVSELIIQFSFHLIFT